MIMIRTLKKHRSNRNSTLSDLPHSGICVPFLCFGSERTKTKMIIRNGHHHHHDFVLLLLGVFMLSSVITTEASAHCNQSCNGVTHNNLPYPFGFSHGCHIRLNCSSTSSSTTGEIFIGDFQVQNVTSDNILINIPQNCTRSINSLKPLFHHNYALTSQNAFLLQNCSSPPNGCVIPSGLMESQFGLHRCSNSDPLYCYSIEEKKADFMSYAKLAESKCRLLFSSIAVVLNQTLLVSLEFQTVQLEWWLEGNACNCSSYANCTRIISPFNAQPGFRCGCMEGYEGDGFLAGSGCRKVSSNCNTSTYFSGKCGGTARLGFLIGGVIAGASLMAALAFLCYIIRRQSTCLRIRNRTKQLLSEATGSYNVPFYTYKEIERATSGFSDKYRLGNGAYGTVYSGKLHSEEWVAIKKIRYRDGESIEQVMNEIKLISSVNHPNLVRLLGCCIEKGEQILVYEFMPNGTLCQHLQRERGTGLPWTIRLSVASETAQAIAHLHFAMNPPIYHRDIKSSNILLDFNFSSKAADFGLSRLGLAEFSHISTAPQGTPGYLDPQYHQNFHLSDKSDVYSFGVVLVEIITAMKVVDFSRPQNEVNLAAFAMEKIGKGCVDDIIDPFLEPHRDAWTLSSIHKVGELAFRCLAFHSETRPSMMEVAAELEHIRLSTGGWTPLDPLEESICFDSSPDLCHSSLPEGYDKLHSVTVKNLEVEKPKLVVPQLGNYVLSEVKDLSPVSVREVWSFSEESSPSTNSLLYNIVH